MPQFIPTMSPSEADLDDFTKAYFEAMEWLLPEGDDEEAGRDEATGFSPELIASSIADCKGFQEANAELLRLAYDHQEITYGEAQAGHDFYLTREGHGAGFWDRGLGEVGAELTRDAKVYGTVDLCIGDDGLIYGM